MNEKCFISIIISLKFVPEGPIDNKATLVQVMAWRRTGDKPLPAAMLTQFTDTYIITLLPAWGYDTLQPGDPRGSQRGVRTAF